MRNEFLWKASIDAKEHKLREFKQNELAAGIISPEEDEEMICAQRFAYQQRMRESSRNASMTLTNPSH